MDMDMDIDVADVATGGMTRDIRVFAAPEKPRSRVFPATEKARMQV
jgi:hypothetical protein